MLDGQCSVLFDVCLACSDKVAILDESTRSGGVGATISALVAEGLYDELDAPVRFDRTNSIH